jgi:methylglutaconyl-CoA hydratase
LADAWERILVEHADAIATLTLNRPDKRNALDARTVAELKDALRECDESKAVRVIVLRGSGPDFCAGADLAELERIAQAADPLVNVADADALGELFILMRQVGQPIIAAVHGNAIAGGAGLATACDLIVAAESSQFGYPEVHLGFVPAMVTALLRRAVGEKRIFELITLGERFGAQQAREWGLVARIFPDASFAADSRAFALALAGRSDSAMRLCKRLLYGIDGMSFGEAIARGAEINAIARATPDCRDGVRRFLDRQKS